MPPVNWLLYGAKRQYARASVFLEGFEGTPEYAELSEKFINGGLTSAQYTQASIALTTKQLAMAKHDPQ